MLRLTNDNYFTLTEMKAFISYVLCRNMALYPTVVSESYHAV
jgi:hypothetical protein